MNALFSRSGLFPGALVAAMSFRWMTANKWPDGRRIEGECAEAIEFNTVGRSMG